MFIRGFKNINGDALAGTSLVPIHARQPPAVARELALLPAYFVAPGLYRLGVFPSVKLPVPVIVVGNLTVGGSGKTPLVLWLASFLRQKGMRPGIVLRGYGGSAADWPHGVTPQHDPDVVGDEAVTPTCCPSSTATATARPTR